MTIPNLLSLFRLLLVPVFPLVFFQSWPNARQWAVLIYLVAFLTDIADGWIARHFNQITPLGRVLDPLADKLMTFMVILCITIEGIIPLWTVAVFFCKELAMAIGHVPQAGGRHLRQLAGKSGHGGVFRGVRPAGALPRHPPALGHGADFCGFGYDHRRVFKLSLSVYEITAVGKWS